MKCYEHPEIDAIATCTECGKFICNDCMVDMGGKAVCKSCTSKAAEKVQTMVVAPQAPARKDPMLAAILSFIGIFVPLAIGLGYIYLGQIKKGIVITVVYIVAMIMCYVLCYVLIGCCLIIMLYGLGFYLVYDAYQTGVKMNNGEILKDWFD